jgi:hypothetical protein
MAYVKISYGEIIDKYTILEIKLKNITDVNKREHIQEELAIVLPIVKSLTKGDILELTQNLKSINQSLWVIEDQIRMKERISQFDEEFIDLARSVYLKNDERSKIKYKINILTHSPLIEEKSYQS